MNRPGQPCIKGYPYITNGIDPVDLLPEELNLSEFRDATTGLSEENHGAFRDTGDPPFSQPPPHVAEICLHVGEQRWLTGRG